MRKAVVVSVLIAVLSGCAIEGGELMTGTTDTGQGTVVERRTGAEAGVLKGRVVDAAGDPVAGAQIVADNQLLYNSNLVMTTDENGRYRVSTDVPTATFRVTGTVTRSFEGRDYTMELTPHDDTPFAGTDGAVRDFTWRLTGKRSDGLGFYGSMVLFHLESYNPQNPEVFLQDEDVVLTLTPQGPLIDGSPGEVITRRAERGGDGSGVLDVPIGRYEITAEHLGNPLRIRLRDTGEYGPSVITGFSPFLTTIHRIQLDLKP
ncbi:carboxypeptidase-like regulatory domain-containing protein [Nonomuraea sp. NPDC046570]|uniref:carboxypeptidase-like regulatory domain-containing protein n=1 Tax=Nonomuraea sp. NPDC046570 TaxID=3155255 RepID=UPI0033FBD1DF